MNLHNWERLNIINLKYFFKKNTLTLKFLYSKVNTIKLKQMIVEQIMAKSNVTTFHNWGSISFLLLSVEVKTDSFSWHGQFRSLLSREKKTLRHNNTYLLSRHSLSSLWLSQKAGAKTINSARKNHFRAKHPVSFKNQHH